MPTYEYRCEKCEHEFEVEQRITADRLEKCPKCKKKALKRLIGTGNFILKGGGWYADLYSGSSNKRPSSSPSSTGGSKSDSSGSKGETKSAPKSESKSTSKGSTKSSE